MMLSQQRARALLVAGALYLLPPAAFLVVWPLWGLGTAVTVTLAVLVVAALACCGALSFLAARLRVPLPEGCALHMSCDAGEARQVQKRYDRQAALYDLMEAPMELMGLRRLRRRFWRGVSGPRLLEVGVGTGKNIPHYPPGARVVAVDISPRMLRRAASRARRLDREVDLILADAQRLPFRDGAFDTAAATFLFCSVPDPLSGLREVRRVVREEGRVHLLEHVRARSPLIGRLMDLLNPLWVRVTGANINRDTVSNVERAGIALEQVESRSLGIVKLMRGSPRAALAVEKETAGDVAHR